MRQGRREQMMSMEPTAGWVAAWVHISLGKFVLATIVSVGYDMSHLQRGWDIARAGCGTVGRGVVWYGEPIPSDGGVTGPGDDGNDADENVGDGVPKESKRTCFPGIVVLQIRMGIRKVCGLSLRRRENLDWKRARSSQLYPLAHRFSGTVVGFESIRRGSCQLRRHRFTASAVQFRRSMSHTACAYL